MSLFSISQLNLALSPHYIGLVGNSAQVLSCHIDEQRSEVQEALLVIRPCPFWSSIMAPLTLGDTRGNPHPEIQSCLRPTCVTA